MDAAVGAHSAHCGAQHSAQRAPQAAEQVGPSDFYTWGWYSETGFHIGMDHNFVYGADTIAEVKILISPILRWSHDLWNQLLSF
jgi:hypothetical protein